MERHLSPLPWVPNIYCHRTPKTLTLEGDNSQVTHVKCFWALTVFLTRIRFLHETPPSSVRAQPHVLGGYWYEFHCLSVQVFTKFHFLNSLAQLWLFLLVSYSTSYWMFFLGNFHLFIHLIWRPVQLQYTGRYYIHFGPDILSVLLIIQLSLISENPVISRHVPLFFR